MVNESDELAGRTALVTGGARNIGLAVAKVLASGGADVAVADICRDLKTIPYGMSDHRTLEEAVSEISALGARSLGITCDVRAEAQVKAAIERVIREFGQLDILVNNAGVMSLYPIAELSEEAWDEVVDVCLKGAFFCCKQAIPHMAERRYGKIINIASVAGHVGLGMSTHYCAAKHGVVGLTKALAKEVAELSINVNAVCPGTVESPMLKGLASQLTLDEDVYAHFSQKHLFQDRHITAADIARAVRWLASDESRCITGTTINVDAGWSVGG